VTTLLIATRNRHKVGEIRTILGESYEYLTLNELPKAPAALEDAGSFAGNATKKAVELAKWLAARHGPSSGEQVVGNRTGDFFVLADDSGLEVDALGGAPGVHSARFAALDTGAVGNSATAENNGKLLRLLAGVPAEKRTARFRCVLALVPVLEPNAEGSSPVCYADEFETQTELFEGSCEGRIIEAARGQGGFGYDPLFMPVGYSQTFGELGEAIKNGLSHRAKALQQLKQRLRGKSEIRSSKSGTNRKSEV
jgi:XTP/dITP diphosphohydrolase